jgi:hypothetical protein
MQLTRRKRISGYHFRLQYLLQEKLLTQRIVEDEFAKAKEALEGKP